MSDLKDNNVEHCKREFDKMDNSLKEEVINLIKKYCITQKDGNKWATIHNLKDFFKAYISTGYITDEQLQGAMLYCDYTSYNSAESSRCFFNVSYKSPILQANSMEYFNAREYLLHDYLSMESSEFRATLPDTLKKYFLDFCTEYGRCPDKQESEDWAFEQKEEFNSRNKPELEIIIIKSQEEFDRLYPVLNGSARTLFCKVWIEFGTKEIPAIIKGDLRVYIKKSFCAYVFDEVSVLAYDNATICLYNNAKVYAFENCKIYAWNNANIFADDNVQVYAYNKTEVIHAHDYVSVWLYHYSTALAQNNSTVYAYNDSCVSAEGNAKVYAKNNVTVYARHNSKIYANDNVCIEANHESYIELSDKAYVKLDNRKQQEIETD